MAWSCNVPIAPPSLLLLGIHVLAILVDLVSALLSLRKPARCFVGAFTVIKKDGNSLRLASDCRPADA